MGQAQENINPLALAVLAVACVIILSGTRQRALKAVLFTAAIIPLGQRFYILGLHIHFLRILILVGLLRQFQRGEMRGLQWILLDKLFVAWALVGMVCGLLRHGSAEVVGLAYNSLGSYFLVRSLTKEADDVVEALGFLSIVAVIIGSFMACEALTHHDVFAIFGGVPFVDDLRDGRARCQGPFRQPIMAGCFGASLFPLMAGLWYRGVNRKGRAVAGAIASLVITVTAVSSGALMAFGAACLGLWLWRYRDNFKLFRRVTVVVILGLAVVMKAPVWYLIDRVSGIIGGGGWHRAYLIDQFVQHFTQWALIGTSYTASWGEGGLVLEVDPNNMDITNHFIVQGVNGGLLMFGLFIAILVQCFKIAGRKARSDSFALSDRRLCWALGVTLATHATAFISVSYFDQSLVFFYWLLAVFACCAGEGFFGESEGANDIRAQDQPADAVSESAGFEAGLSGARPLLACS